MKTFEVNRLVSGNRVFPTRVQITDFGVTIIKPGVFSNQEEYIPLSNITWVKIDTPLLGFSTIEIGTSGKSFIINGFSKSDAKEIKQLISNQ